MFCFTLCTTSLRCSGLDCLRRRLCATSQRNRQTFTSCFILLRTHGVMMMTYKWMDHFIIFLRGGGRSEQLPKKCLESKSREQNHAQRTKGETELHKIVIEVKKSCTNTRLQKKKKKSSSPSSPSPPPKKRCLLIASGIPRFVIWFQPVISHVSIILKLIVFCR